MSNKPRLVIWLQGIRKRANITSVRQRSVRCLPSTVVNRQSRPFSSLTLSSTNSVISKLTKRLPTYVIDKHPTRPGAPIKHRHQDGPWPSPPRWHLIFNSTTMRISEHTKRSLCRIQRAAAHCGAALALSQRPHDLIPQVSVRVVREPCLSRSIGTVGQSTSAMCIDADPGNIAPTRGRLCRSRVPCLNEEFLDRACVLTRPSEKASESIMRRHQNHRRRTHDGRLPVRHISQGVVAKPYFNVLPTRGCHRGAHHVPEVVVHIVRTLLATVLFETQSSGKHVTDIAGIVIGEAHRAHCRTNDASETLIYVGIARQRARLVHLLVKLPRQKLTILCPAHMIQAESRKRLLLQMITFTRHAALHTLIVDVLFLKQRAIRSIAIENSLRRIDAIGVVRNDHGRWLRAQRRVHPVIPLTAEHRVIVAVAPDPPITIGTGDGCHLLSIVFKPPTGLLWSVRRAADTLQAWAESLSVGDP